MSTRSLGLVQGPAGAESRAFNSLGFGADDEFGTCDLASPSRTGPTATASRRSSFRKTLPGRIGKLAGVEAFVFCAADPAGFGRRPADLGGRAVRSGTA